ncbi:MAG: hypothetical protein RML46_05150 [Anaerolineae bacterium]|nr:hypothetical protein [Anaerolineae bacterium]
MDEASASVLAHGLPDELAGSALNRGANTDRAKDFFPGTLPSPSGRSGAWRGILLGLIGLVAGVALGLLVGWVLWPVQYTNTAPAQLRQDYRTDYILMVAAAYHVEGNAEAALGRLAWLDPETPTRPLVELTETLIAENGRPGDIAMLVRLAEALGATTSAMEPYLGGIP